VGRAEQKKDWTTSLWKKGKAAKTTIEKGGRTKKKRGIKENYQRPIG